MTLVRRPRGPGRSLTAGSRSSRASLPGARRPSTMPPWLKRQQRARRSDSWSCGQARASRSTSREASRGRRGHGEPSARARPRGRMGTRRPSATALRASQGAFAPSPPSLSRREPAGPRSRCGALYASGRPPHEPVDSCGEVKPLAVPLGQRSARVNRHTRLAALPSDNLRARAAQLGPWMRGHDWPIAPVEDGDAAGAIHFNATTGLVRFGMVTIT